MSNAEAFFRRTGHKVLFNITSIDNISQIIENGILSHFLAAKIPHTSVANESVQSRRRLVIVPGGKKLHSYANLYFTYNNPMLSFLRYYAEGLCILCVSSEVLDIDGCVVTDRNASTDLAKFYSPEDGIEAIDFTKIFAKYWLHDDRYEYLNHKAIKCAEVLIPDKVSYEYVLSACVVSNDAKAKLLAQGFDKPISVKPTVFYR